MTLSICAIVKDEESRMEDFLLSIKDFADEIIIIDTGSSDRTIDTVKAVSQREGMNVVVDRYTPPGDFHFGKARNAALRKASMDYILVLDADERPGSEFKKEIKNFLEKEKPFVAAIKLVNEHMPHYLNYPLRITKNHQNIFHGEEERDRVNDRVIHHYQVKEFPAPVLHCQRERSVLYAPQTMLVRVILKANEEERSNRPFIIYFLRAVRNFWRKFYQTYFKKKAYKDGKNGFKFAFLKGLAIFLTVLFVGLKPKKNYKYWQDPKWQPPQKLS